MATAKLPVTLSYTTTVRYSVPTLYTVCYVYTLSGAIFYYNTYTS